jgi:Glycine-rich domain-containing protein-like
MMLTTPSAFVPVQPLHRTPCDGVGQHDQPIVITTRSAQPWPALSNTPALRARIQDFHQRCTALGLVELIQFLPSPDNRRLWTIAIEHYCYFLCLMDLYPDRALVPTPLIDQVWHAHILDTSRYRRDCLALFGRFVDHQPLSEPTSLLGLSTTSETDTIRLLHHHFQIEAGGDGMAIGRPNSPHSLGSARQLGACGRGVSPYHQR